MDSLTQAVLGGAIQGSMLGRIQGRRSIMYGALLATLPDLDNFIKYTDPVSNMTYHRSFSHSIFTLSILALILTLLVRKTFKNQEYTALRLFMTLLLVLITHPILDSFTIYGTQLFWPFSLTPESWSAIFIIDPIYTTPLFISFILIAIKGISNRRIFLLNIALLFSSIYLIFGLIGRFSAEYRVVQAFQNEGIQVIELRAVPTPYNILVWRVLAKTPDGYYYEAVSSWFDTSKPEWIRESRGLELTNNLKGNHILERLKWFTNDWLRYDLIDNKLVVSDIRMGIPSLYSFRFEMGVCSNSGEILPSIPKVWPSRMANVEETKLIFSRILYQYPSLPLAEWSNENLRNKSNFGKCYNM